MSTPKAHDVLRPLRLAARHVRYSRFWLRGRRDAVIEAELEATYQAVNGFLGGLGVEYWIAYGTLLGWYRRGHLLAHDYDIDFGAPAEAFETVWAARDRLPVGCEMIDTSHRHDGPKLYVRRGAWEADIYFYRALSDGRLQNCLRSWIDGDVAPFDASLILPRQPATFLGAPTWVPQQPEAWLRHTYGYIGEDAVQDPATGYWSRR